MNFPVQNQKTNLQITNITSFLNSLILIYFSFGSFIRIWTRPSESIRSRFSANKEKKNDNSVLSIILKARLKQMHIVNYSLSTILSFSNANKLPRTIPNSLWEFGIFSYRMKFLWTEAPWIRNMVKMNNFSNILR